MLFYEIKIRVTRRQIYRSIKTCELKEYKKRKNKQIRSNRRNLNRFDLLIYNFITFIFKRSIATIYSFTSTIEVSRAKTLKKYRPLDFSACFPPIQRKPQRFPRGEVKTTSKGPLDCEQSAFTAINDWQFAKIPGGFARADLRRYVTVQMRGHQMDLRST